MTASSNSSTPSGTLLSDKQRADSLGRSSTLLSNDNFRRSTDDSRRRTSLRGSLSRALGLKIKQDLLHRRQDEKDKSEERDFPSGIPLLGPPPPLPPGLPGKGINGNTNGGYSSHHLPAEQPLDDFTSSILRHVGNSHFSLAQKPEPPLPRPSSVLEGGSSSRSNSRHTDFDPDGSGSGSAGGDRNDDPTSSMEILDKVPINGNGHNSDTASDLAAKKHRRVKSISEVDHIPVHTPV
ncbi:unnamed protein product [Allacma fusca]|uniref:Uncharacterized protein n=1 Tax=Allacma fusca TaxID=39272 RepID=A0A8J2Q4G5_9HEXA|nr:unnamed protein product [Allacma fusca]